jgi:hypothetical protein
MIWADLDHFFSRGSGVEPATFGRLPPVVSSVFRVAALGLAFLLATPVANARPPQRIDPSRGGVLVAHGQDEPGGFRLDHPPAPRPPDGARPRPEDAKPAKNPPPPEAALLPTAETTLPAVKDPTPGYICLGLGAALGLVGSVFAANAVAAMGDFPSVKRGQVFDEDFETKLEDAQTAVLVNGLLTSVFFSASVSSLIAGTLYLATD